MYCEGSEQNCIIFAIIIDNVVASGERQTLFIHCLTNLSYCISLIYRKYTLYILYSRILLSIASAIASLFNINHSLISLQWLYITCTYILVNTIYSLYVRHWYPIDYSSQPSFLYFISRTPNTQHQYSALVCYAFINFSDKYIKNIIIICGQNTNNIII